MRGTTALVTGASSGIGRAAAVELARAGARVIMHARNEERGEAARRFVAETSGSEDTDLLLADFGDLASVRRAAEKVLRDHERLDVLVANAGAIYRTRQLTDSGNEFTFQTNHLAHFLLCELLEPMLIASAPARVVTVSSDAHHAAWRGINFKDPTFGRGWSPFRAYAHSKLANIMFCYEHARRLQGSGVTSNVMHPGLLNSGFGARGYGWYGVLIEGFVNPLLGRTPEQGADTVVWLSASPDVDGITGGYFKNGRPHRSSWASLDTGAQRRLWELSEEAIAAE